MQLRKAANHPCLLRVHYTDAMVATMAKLIRKVGAAASLRTPTFAWPDGRTCSVPRPLGSDAGRTPAMWTRTRRALRRTCGS